MTLLSPVFLTTGNVGNVLAQTAVIAVLAIGQLLVILTRGIDLSVGSTLALSRRSSARSSSPRRPSGAVGHPGRCSRRRRGRRVNGVVYVWGRLPHPFIITLATLSIARGLALCLAGGQPMPRHAAIVGRIGGGSIGWFPYSAFVVVGVALLVLRPGCSTLVWGRWIYAVGGNPEAARRTGIPVNGGADLGLRPERAVAGVAAIITSGRLNAGSPTFGNLAELDSIAAVIIGGASFLGGRGTSATRWSAR